MKDQDMNISRFRVEGMDCASCATKIDTAVRRVRGVEEVSVSVVGGTLTVTHAPAADVDDMTRRVAQLGYGIERAPNAAEGDTAAQGLARLRGGDEKAWWQGSKARLTMVCGAALIVAFALAQLLPQTRPWGFVLATAIGLIPIARRAFAAARNGSPFTIETLMTVAAAGALVIDAAEEAAVVVVLFLIGELLEGIAAGRARASIRALADLMPRTALLETAGGTETVAADGLAVGALVRVRPGDRVPADGVVVSGASAVNEAPVTGESLPRAKEAGDTVFAGTVNGDGLLRVEVTATAADNTIARVIALVEQAQESKAPTERFIDRFSKFYTPGVMVVAAAVAVLPPLLVGAEWATWVYRGLAVLLIGCPCALVISTPAAIAAALSAGARRGLLMKGGAVLEKLGKVNYVAFDKTGTLTAGRPQVTDIVPGAGYDEDAVMRLAAALEAGSSHPLALAILARADENGVAVTSAENTVALPGQGLAGEFEGVRIQLLAPRAAAEAGANAVAWEAQITALADEGKTVSVLLRGEDIAGLIALRDEARADAATGLATLRRLGAEMVMLTGDTARTAAAIASSLNISVQAELLPHDKQRVVGELQAEGYCVAKVGDGINDAPALAAADVGIAIGGGTDVALETADAAVLHGRIPDVANMVLLSRATMTNIIQNITIALGLKVVFLVTTVTGITGLWPAILADTGATVLVTLNAMRLLAWRGARNE